ncbi:MAG: trimethylamine methyltransferase family protein [Chloroflexota bacterium]
MIQTHGTSMTSAHYSRLGPQECEKIHMASLEILARIGINVHDEKALGILVKGGAQADGIRVRIPEFMVTQALATAPTSITLYNRNGKVAMGQSWRGKPYPYLYSR